MQVQNYYTELDGVKVQQIINTITKAYVYAGLGGFPELPVPGQRSAPQPMVPLNQFNPALLASLPPPPGFKPPPMPAGASAQPPLFPMPGMGFPPPPHFHQQMPFPPGPPPTRS